MTFFNCGLTKTELAKNEAVNVVLVLLDTTKVYSIRLPNLLREILKPASIVLNGIVMNDEHILFDSYSSKYLKNIESESCQKILTTIQDKEKRYKGYGKPFLYKTIQGTKFTESQKEFPAYLWVCKKKNIQMLKTKVIKNGKLFYKALQDDCFALLEYLKSFCQDICETDYSVPTYTKIDYSSFLGLKSIAPDFEYKRNIVLHPTIGGDNSFMDTIFDKILPLMVDDYCCSDGTFLLSILDGLMELNLLNYYLKSVGSSFALSYTMPHNKENNKLRLEMIRRDL